MQKDFLGCGFNEWSINVSEKVAGAAHCAGEFTPEAEEKLEGQRQLLVPGCDLPTGLFLPLILSIGLCDWLLFILLFILFLLSEVRPRKDACSGMEGEKVEEKTRWVPKTRNPMKLEMEGKYWGYKLWHETNRHLKRPSKYVLVQG